MYPLRENLLEGFCGSRFRLHGGTGIRNMNSYIYEYAYKAGWRSIREGQESRQGEWGMREECGKAFHMSTHPLVEPDPIFPLSPPSICSESGLNWHNSIQRPPRSAFPLFVSTSLESSIPFTSAFQNVVYSISPRSRVTSSMKSYLIWSNFSLPLFILYTSALMIHTPLFVYLPHSPFVFIVCEAASSLGPAGAGLEFYPSTPKLATSGVGRRQD